MDLFCFYKDEASGAYKFTLKKKTSKSTKLKLNKRFLGALKDKFTPQIKWDFYGETQSNVKLHKRIKSSF